MARYWIEYEAILALLDGWWRVTGIKSGISRYLNYQMFLWKSGMARYLIGHEAILALRDAVWRVT